MNTRNQNYYAIIPAAGQGTRMNNAIPKQYLKLSEKTILEHTLQCFITHPRINKIVVVLNPSDCYWQTLAINTSEKILIAEGGDERCCSVLNGLELLTQFATEDDWILVHDAVRPCLHHADIDKLIQQLTFHPVGGLLAIPVKDTLKRTDNLGNVVETLDRKGIWCALTPQMFRFAKLKKALRNAVAKQQWVTDEAAAIELGGGMPLIVEGRHDNIKITYPSDLALAKKILNRDEVSA